MGQHSTTGRDKFHAIIKGKRVLGLKFSAVREALKKNRG